MSYKNRRNKYNYLKFTVQLGAQLFTFILLGRSKFTYSCILQMNKEIVYTNLVNDYV